MKPALSAGVQETIDSQAFHSYHLRIMLLCALAVFMDGFDAQAMGFVAPTLAAEWHISRGQLGPILTAGLVGMLCGSLFFGPLADRFGRRKILVFCTFGFGVLSLMTARASSLRELEILRVITGFSLGGALPNAIALTSEYMPSRFRATCVMMMFVGFSLGAAVGGFVAAAVTGSAGWRAVFVIGGAVPCLIAPLLMALPESVRFLLLKGGHDDQVREYLSKIAPQSDLPAGTRFAIQESADAGFVVARLFTDGRAVMTLLLWVIFFMSLLELYFLNSWLPTVLHDSGLPLATAQRVTAMFQVGGAVGTLALGQIFDRTKSFMGLAVAYAGAAICVFFIGRINSSLTLEALMVFSAGICVVGAQTGSNAMAAEMYPTAIRATGVGWALGIGRVGSIVGPMLGAVLLSSQVEMKKVFAACAIPPAIAVIATLIVNRRSANSLTKNL